MKGSTFSGATTARTSSSTTGKWLHGKVGRAEFTRGFAVGKLYVAIDGDDVGRRLEYYMIINDGTTLTTFSSAFTSAMDWLIAQLSRSFNSTILFSGGDNLLAEIENRDRYIEILSTLSEQFMVQANSTLSIGIGTNLREAYFALKIAKASGKNCIKIYHEANNG